jgi:hypothetical protein
MKLYLLKSIPYYNSIYQEYTNILVINKDPEGPLKEMTKKIRLNKLSPFTTKSNICGQCDCVIALKDLNSCELMCVDELPNLFEYLLNNGYVIDTSVTKILQKTSVKPDGNMICMLQY